MPVKKQVFSPHVKHQKPALRLNSQMSQLSRQEERNYEELIRKRKTQRLKISEHRVSVTIQNESHSTSFFKDLRRDQKQTQKQELKQRETSLETKTKNLESKGGPKMQKIEPKMVESKFNVGEVLRIQDENLENDNFLETMRFRMKVDESQERNEPNFPSVRQIPQKNLVHQSRFPFIATQESIFDTQFDERLETKNDQIEQFSSIKRKLFMNKQNIENSKVSEKQIPIKSKQNSRIRPPMQEINFENTFSSIKKLHDMNSGKLPLESSRNKNILMNNLGSFEVLIEKQKFNSGHKNSQDSILKEIFKNYDNEAIIESQILGRDHATFDKQKNDQDFREVESQYINSRRKLSELYSHRMADDNNKSFMNLFSKEVSSFSKDKNNDEKENKLSSRMIFSHRMQEVISGRKEKQNEEQDRNNEKISSVNSSYSFREKKKGATKLEFWNRIKSTINE